MGTQQDERMEELARENAEWRSRLGDILGTVPGETLFDAARRVEKGRAESAEHAKARQEMEGEVRFVLEACEGGEYFDTTLEAAHNMANERDSLKARVVDLEASRDGACAELNAALARVKELEGERPARLVSMDDAELALALEKAAQERDEALGRCAVFGLQFEGFEIRVETLAGKLSICEAARDIAIKAATEQLANRNTLANAAQEAMDLLDAQDGETLRDAAKRVAMERRDLGVSRDEWHKAWVTLSHDSGTDYRAGKKLVAELEAKLAKAEAETERLYETIERMREASRTDRARVEELEALRRADRAWPAATYEWWQAATYCRIRDFLGLDGSTASVLAAVKDMSGENKALNAQLAQEQAAHKSDHDALTALGGGKHRHTPTIINNAASGIGLAAQGLQAAADRLNAAVDRMNEKPKRGIMDRVREATDKAMQDLADKAVADSIEKGNETIRRMNDAAASGQPPWHEPLRCAPPIPIRQAPEPSKTVLRWEAVLGEAGVDHGHNRTAFLSTARMSEGWLSLLGKRGTVEFTVHEE